MADFPTRFSFQDAEPRLYEQWRKAGAFKPETAKDAHGVSHLSKPVKERKEPFTVMMPPPNATGILHLGHAARIAAEDTLVRYHRMLGNPTLYVPGTDHAGIATQSKVEEILLQEEGKTRHDLGREAFLKKVEAFVAQSQHTIREQIRRTGASCDWDREAYTFSDELNHAVFTIFQRMHKAGLLYRGGRSVHWDPVLQTTVADDELEYETEQTPFYTFQYGPFRIGTVRPETKFGDKYVVVHPNDERYKDWNHGDTFECEWINGTITATVIKDEAADPTAGTGAMTITPWHSSVDYEIAQRHDLDCEQIIDLEGTLLPIAGAFAGRSVLKDEIQRTREDIVAAMQEKGLVVSIDEQYEHNVAVNYRGGGVIEPHVMMQWFVDVNKAFPMSYPPNGDPHKRIQGIEEGQMVTLKELMLHVVTTKQIEIVPDRFEKIYIQWVENLRDWCVSRQLWWGHRIPAWYPKEAYGDASQAVISQDDPSDRLGAPYVQDTDTLDTWFSSMLWTFSPFGWPDTEHNPESDLNYFHPTSVLETGRDILPFWVARMILASTFARGEVPFRRTLLAGMITDKNGKKMSKSKGNGIDPIEMIDKYGADALRLSLMVGTTPGNNARLHEDKIKRYRNFATKLWNVSRFMHLRFPDTFADQSFDSSVVPKAATLADQWILSRLTEARDTVERHFQDLQLGYAADALYAFTWHELADWYVELSKSEAQNDSGAVARFVLETLLKSLHPFIPFVTEALWQSLGHTDLLILAQWPSSSTLTLQRNAQAETTFSNLQEIAAQIRKYRAMNALEPAQPLSYYVHTTTDPEPGADEETLHYLLSQLEQLCRLQKNTENRGVYSTARFTFDHTDFYLGLDIETEQVKQKLTRTIQEQHAELTKLLNIVNNEGFQKNASQEEKDKRAQQIQELETEHAQNKKALDRLN